MLAELDTPHTEQNSRPSTLRIAVASSEGVRTPQAEHEEDVGGPGADAVDRDKAGVGPRGLHFRQR